MENESVDVIRENTRILLNKNRRLRREDDSNFRRSLQSSEVSSENVLNIVDKLKTKSSITESELKVLKNALRSDQKTIESVLNTHGALRGLVRELIGQDIGKQMQAVDCLCNLALGDGRACSTVAKSAGPYLVARLDNVTSKVSENCAYALGTLASSGPKVCVLLVTQGALTILTRLLSSNCNEELASAALYAVTHIVSQLKDELSSQHLSDILQSISKLNLNSSVQKLLFALSCHENFIETISTHFPGYFEEKILNNLPLVVLKHVSSCKDNALCCELVHSLRILANLNLSKSEVHVLFTMNFEGRNFKEIACYLVNENNDFVKESLLWLLGNFYNCYDEFELVF